MRPSTFRVLVAIGLGIGSLLSCQPPPDEDIESVEAAAIAGGNYLVKNVNSGKCADVAAGSLLDGGNVIQWTCRGATNQQWTIKDLGTGYYELRNVNSGKCLDVYQASTADGANVDQWGCNGHNSQQWKFVSTSSGVYELRPRNSGKCLDVKGASLLDGANIQQWSCRSVNQQRWRLSVLSSCTPESNGSFCSRLGKNCGTVSGTDNCGNARTVSCGACTAPDTCGGGGTANVCGSAGTVTFQNTGTTSGWDRVYTQKAGTITQVSSPVYRSSSALRTTQTYISSDGLNYHSEVVKSYTERTGEDRYFGQAVMLPGDWIWHNQNVTFQQWAPDDNSGPWLLMFVQNDHLWAGGRAFSVHDFGAISKGAWLRIVTRIKLASSGVFEVWVDGIKRGSVTGDFTVSGGSIRWSSGIYCTRWDTDAPAGQSTLSIFHDQLRVATSYSAADPANWN
jgi:ricin-type beta-trefoil lectin protein/polysaccharide lyase-like protein